MGPVFAFLIASLLSAVLVSSGYYRWRHGNRIPPKGWFRFSNEFLRRRTYDDPKPGVPMPRPRVSVALGMLIFAFGVLVLTNAWLGWPPDRINL